MKKLIFIFVFIAASAAIFAQNYHDAVYLKDGNVVRGIITEQIPGKSIKIETAGGNILVFQMADIDSVAIKESTAKEIPSAPADTIEIFRQRYYYRDIEISSTAGLRKLMADNPEALQLLNSTRVPKIVAVALAATGGFITGFTAMGYIQDGDPPLWMLAAGLGCIAVAMPVSIAQNIKIKKAVNIYNSGLRTGYYSQPETRLFLSMSNNGIGLTLKF